MESLFVADFATPCGLIDLARVYAFLKLFPFEISESDTETII
jgi:hypothetical protein